MISRALIMLAFLGVQAPDDLDFWKDPERAKAAAAAELVLSRNVWATLAMRELGQRYSVWGNELVVARDQVPSLDEESLNLIEDKRAVPDFRGRAPDEIKGSESAFQKIYSEALVYSFLVSPEAFALRSKEQRDVTFSHLYNTPDKYRGQVLRIEGTLARVRKTEAPLAAQRLGAYKVLYEGWVFGKTKNAPPFWIIFPNKPEDVPVAERMERNITFDGYFISIIRYRAAGKDLYAPLLIGPTVVPKAPARIALPPVSGPLLLGIGAFVAIVVVTLIVLNVLFSRGDRRVRQHLENLQATRGLDVPPADMDPAQSEETAKNNEDEPKA